MATMARLREVKKSLGAEIPNSQLQWLAKNSQATTPAAIVDLFREKGAPVNADEAKALADLVRQANLLEKAAAAETQTEEGGIPENHSDKNDSDDDAQHQAPEGVSSEQVEVSADAVAQPDDEPAKESAPVEATESTEEAEPVTAPTVETVAEPVVPESFPYIELRDENLKYSAQDYDEIDIMASVSAELRNLVISGNGPHIYDISWSMPEREGVVFVLTGDTQKFPVTIHSADESSWRTSQSTVVIETAARFFSLFRFDAPGTAGTLVAQGRLLGDVQSLQAQAFPNQVNISWVTNDELARVAVYRSRPNAALPANPPASLRLAIDEQSNTFVDHDVRPGQEFEYRAFLEWEGPTGEVLTTTGKRVTVYLDGVVPDVAAFSATKQALFDKVDLRYRRPELGSVRLFQMSGLPAADLLRAQGSGEFDSSLIEESAVSNWLGAEILDSPVPDGDMMVVPDVPMPSGDKGSRTYIAVSVLGRKSKIAAIDVVQQVGVIEFAQLIDRFDYQLLRVAIPAGAESLAIWTMAKGQTFDSDDLAEPNRKVAIQSEYRRFGGIIFGKDIPGLPTVESLPLEPLSIYVRGISSYQGNDYMGPLFEVAYPGRMELHYRRSARAGKAVAIKRSWFGAKGAKVAAVVPAREEKLEVKVIPPRGFAGQLNLEVLAAESFPLDSSAHGLRMPQFMNIQVQDYQEFGPLRSETGGDIQVASNLCFRVAPAKTQTSTFGDVSIFAVEQNAEGRSGVAAAAGRMNSVGNVVIIGAKQSGKTTFVQSLINYLEQQLAPAFDAKMQLEDPDDEVSAKKLHDMQTFVREGKLPQGTPSAAPFVGHVEEVGQEGHRNPDDPRVSMKFLFNNGGDVPLKNIRIVDVAGEDMDQLESMRYYAEAMRKADLIIFLLDPLQLESVQTALAGFPLPPRGTDPFDVMNNLLTILNEKPDERNPRQRVAIAMSKFDQFAELTNEKYKSAISGTITPGMALTRDPNSNSTAMFNSADSELLQRELRAIMERLGVNVFMKRIDNGFTKPDEVRYFALSSLGHGTHASTLDAAGITSFRISDPIRWGLLAP